MTIRTSIGGPLGTAELAQLLGDRPNAAADHRPPAALAVADARLRARQALSALQAIEPPSLSPSSRDAVAALAEKLAAVARGLELLERQIAEGRR